MTNVLLIMSPLADAPNAVAYALRRAKETGAGLVAVAVLDPDLTRRLSTTLTNVGFVGEKVSEDVARALAREQRTHAESLLRQIAQQAESAGVEFTPLLEEGDPVEWWGRVASQHDVHAVVLVAEKRSWLTRLLSGAATLKLPTLAGCEVKIMEN